MYPKISCSLGWIPDLSFSKLDLRSPLSLDVFPPVAGSPRSPPPMSYQLSRTQSFWSRAIPPSSMSRRAVNRALPSGGIYTSHLQVRQKGESGQARDTNEVTQGSPQVTDTIVPTRPVPPSTTSTFVLQMSPQFTFVPERMKTTRHSNHIKTPAPPPKNTIRLMGRQYKYRSRRFIF